VNKPLHVRTLLRRALTVCAATFAAQLTATFEVSAEPGSRPPRIPVDQIGAIAGQHYKGEGLAVTATAGGAVLNCTFQRLKGEATSEGLWLNSTAPGTAKERFRLVATGLGREPAKSRDGANTGDSGRIVIAHSPPWIRTLEASGSVKVDDGFVRFTRPVVTEEYSVSIDGVRQDFLVEHRPEGDGELQLELELTGATAETSSKGARLILDGSGRKLSYSRLRVVDAGGQELAARLRVNSGTRIALLVDDAAAAYPVRIDPTFSDEDWSGTGGLLGADSWVNAAVSDNNGNLYIGGEFTVVGDAAANYIAKWDGSSWSGLGDGLDWNVWSLAVSGTDLYVGGEFSEAGGAPALRIAKWNGSAWSALGSGVGVAPGVPTFDYVKAIAVVGTSVYAAGEFTTAGGVPAANIARWNGIAWSGVGSGVNDEVLALAAIGTNLYVGGAFTNAGGVAANYLARWNGSAWSSVGGGLNDWVWALAASGSDLYVGGEFDVAGGTSALNLARWDGTTWAAVGGGVNDQVSALTVSGSDLYVGGRFSRVGGTTSAFYVAKWDGTSWSAMGPGLHDYVNALAVVGTDLYVGGDFERADDKIAQYIARWDGSAWSAVGSGGLSGEVYAVAVDGTDVYAGGKFSSANVNPANNVARWDGSAWSAVGPGFNDVVNVLLVSGSQLYAGGAFTMAGTTPVTHIAKWDGSAWSGLGSGMNVFGYVFSLAADGTDLYAGGNFFEAGGNSARYIAKWNGSAWSALGTGTNATVGAIGIVGTNVYAGGAFTNAGDVPASFIARWNGTAWSAVGDGLDSQVRAMAVRGTDLYVGGIFKNAGNVALNGIGKWNGSAWSGLGSGVDGFILALATSQTSLYAGGFFSDAGGVTASNVARWDGAAWSALGSGTQGTVHSLAVFGTDLFAGGDFIAAGESAARYMARANIGPLENIPPTVTISSPTTGQSFLTPISIDIDAQAADSDGEIVRVDFFAGTQLLAADDAAPYALTWENVSAGNYTLTARATDDIGTTTISAPVNISVSIPITLPAAPTGLTAKALSKNRTTLHWTDNANNGMVYKIERSVGGKPFKEISQSNSNATYFTDRRLQPGKKYSYRIRACNSAGDSEYSELAKRKVTR
jgi:hypothetical protein